MSLANFSDTGGLLASTCSRSNLSRRVVGPKRDGWSVRIRSYSATPRATGKQISCAGSISSSRRWRPWSQQSEPVQRSTSRLSSSTIARGAVGADLVIVEGAGGWRVPITPSCDMAGLANRLGYPVIVVAQATLGTINHSLLTLEAVERDKQSIAALVLSQRPDDDAEQAVDNARRIASRWAGTVLIHRESHDLGALV